ncbi:U3 small nucleolar ribonucleoprotein IMP4 [Lamellibrachia satsuma]|nr:U3 small nucleolar ribonucleoprotein IMP4 [Lamellibrachia satsuma]
MARRTRVAYDRGVPLSIDGRRSTPTAALGRRRLMTGRTGTRPPITRTTRANSFLVFPEGQQSPFQSPIGDQVQRVSATSGEKQGTRSFLNMLRRQARQRREYIYRKSVEEKERTILEKKQKLKRALDDNKQIPTSLQKDAVYLEKTLDWEDDGADGITSNVDDEYRWAGVEDPKIMITTSRDPSSRLKMFAKEMRLIFPNSQRINRGNYEIKQLVQACRSNEVTDLLIVSEHRGNPADLQHKQL